MHKRKRKSIKEIQEYASKRGWVIVITRAMVEKRRHLLAGANLTGVDLRRVDLRNANLRNANLRNADLYYANLAGANFYSADLTDADLRNTNLARANLDGSVMNWDDRDLIAARLFGAAGDNVQSRMVAGLILISKDWCWNTFLRLENVPASEWALDTLARWVQPGDGAPAVLRERAAAIARTKEMNVEGEGEGDER